MQNISTPSREYYESNFVYVQLLKLLATQSKTVFMGVVSGALTLSIIVHNNITWQWWLSWVVLVVLVQAVRHKVHTRGLLAFDEAGFAVTKTLIDKYCLVSLCSGISQTSVIFFFPWLSDIERVLLSLFTVGLTILAVTSTAGYPKIYLPFAIPQITVLGLAWMLFPGRAYEIVISVALGLIFLVFLSFMVFTYSRKMWQQFEESCRIRFREKALNEKLTQALDAAEIANKSKTRFLATASHDLRQPLHVISFLCAGLSLRKLDAQSTEMVKLLNQVVASLQAQLERLLDISKLDENPAVALFAETNGCFLVEVSPKNAETFEATFRSLTENGRSPFLQIGSVTAKECLEICHQNSLVTSIQLSDLLAAFKSPHS